MDQPRLPAPIDRPVVLTIAGSDSGGGAGIQADLKTIEATGGFGTSAITAVTAQNTTGVESSHVLPIEELDAQIDAVRSDFDVRAVKTGMLATAEIVERVAEHAAELECPIVVDPVMVAATGDRLLTPAAESAYEKLLAEATLVTPNTDEAAVLTDVQPTDEQSARTAGRQLLAAGADAALLKGGHVPGPTVLDTLVTADAVETFRHPRIETDATHGSGCTLSAAIATNLARGDSLSAAVAEGTKFMERAVRYHLAVGEGNGAVHHLVGIRNEAARNEAIEAVYRLVDRLEESSFDASAVETVAVATPFAETIGEVATTEIDASAGATAPSRVRFGASERLARRLLDARETDPDLRVAVECRLDTTLDPPLASAGWTIIERSGEDWRTHVADQLEGSGPIAVIDRDDDPTAVLLIRSVDHAMDAMEGFATP